MPTVKEHGRERSEATRRKIIQAAEAEFLVKGFHGATVSSIAERAGVAAQTVYFVFHNKAALISAVIDNAVLGEESPTVPQDSAWWAAGAAESRPDAALRIIIRGAAPIFARAAPISEILRAAALTDDEVRLTYESHQNLRYKGFREVIEMVATKGTLKEGLDVRSATDIFMTIFGESVYHVMTIERGWTRERFIDWLCGALPELLLG